jgi:hypothetical protein
MNADMFREDPACIYRPLASAVVRNKFPEMLPEESIAVEQLQRNAFLAPPSNKERGAGGYRAPFDESLLNRSN